MGRVLVTGATGFLGGAVLRHIGKAAIAQGRNPAGLAKLRSEGFDCITWTLPFAPPKDAALEDVTSIVHCAGMSSPFGPYQAFHIANVLGTQAVLDLAKTLRVKRFVHISSPSIYFSLRDQLLVDEEAPLPPPFNAYSKSKALAETSVRAAPEINPVILRPRGIYGPGDTALLPRLLKAAGARALPRFRGGRAKIDLTFVNDVVAAVCAALDAPIEHGLAGRSYNISGGEVLPVSQIVEAACARAGIRVTWRDMPLKPALLAARLAETVALCRGANEPAITRYGLALFAFEQSLNLDRARSELGWSPQVSFADGLQQTFSPGPLK